MRSAKRTMYFIVLLVLLMLAAATVYAIFARAYPAHDPASSGSARR